MLGPPAVFRPKCSIPPAEAKFDNNFFVTVPTVTFRAAARSGKPQQIVLRFSMPAGSRMRTAKERCNSRNNTPRVGSLSGTVAIANMPHENMSGKWRERARAGSHGIDDHSEGMDACHKPRITADARVGVRGKAGPHHGTNLPIWTGRSQSTSSRRQGVGSIAVCNGRAMLVKETIA